MPDVGHLGFAPDYESKKGSAPEFLQKITVRDKRGQVKAEDTPPPVEQPQTPLIATETLSDATRAALEELDTLTLHNRFWVRDTQWEVIDIQPDHLKIAVVGFSKQALKRMRRAIDRRT